MLRNSGSRDLLAALAAAGSALIASTTAAWAYLDPGSGSILLQALVGAAAAAAMFIRHFWTRTKQFLRIEKSAEPSSRIWDHSEVPPRVK